ncbi:MULTISPECIES: dihydroorotase family protein [Kosmotoga]|uniref:Amidohydrolase n=1 Tax=Kosmotoga olearia (strain ATCC BAA-1733 / DSM 21960 / TBF 19.5.1) TaxID=521045 RepID=C5CHS4_KOSOT|nr:MULTISPECIES: amidohydrolase family protein [Kosmotoga]ACR80749.1 amidohydrolase [Kosmotoga olearia TBF 19.5.1]OAA19193.1 hypothetical protein DU53_11290 [Kosmotoga sp. DU53]
MKYDLVLIGGEVCDGADLYAANLYISEGKIADITPKNAYHPARASLDCSGLFILPGFIDPHVHLGLRLGRYSSTDDFSSGSDAALAGGVTTIFDFTEPIYDYEGFMKNLTERLKDASVSKIDYGLHITLGGNVKLSPEEVSKLAVETGCPTIKVFTAYGDTNRRTDDGYLYELLKSSGKIGSVVMVHAENDELIKINSKKYPGTFEYLSDIRATESEIGAVIMVALLATKAKGQAYIVHLSSGETVNWIESFAVISRDNIVFETCPQYLALNKKLLKRKDGYLYTFCPPLRSEKESELLVRALRKGFISTVGTDHCPFTVEEKTESDGKLDSVPYGIASLGITYSVVNTLLGGDLSKVVRLLSKNPAKYMGVYPEKGSLLPGTDADITVVDPNERFTVQDPAYGKAEYWPYKDLELKGRVKYTLLRGKLAFDGSTILLDEGNGKFLKRSEFFWGR